MSYAKLEHVMEDILSHNKNTIFMGDFNINYNMNNHTKAHELETKLQLKQLISDCTRVTSETNSLIDLIFTNSPHLHSLSGVIPISISDHYAIYTILNLKHSAKSNRINCIRSRNFKKFNEKLFLYDIYKSQVFHNIYSFEDVNVAWEAWIREFKRICDKHAPCKMLRVKQRTNSWFSKHILDIIYQRDSLHRRAIRQKSSLLMKKYRITRNKVRSVIKRAKREYYTQTINASSRPRHLWNILRTILPSKSNNQVSPSVLSANTFNNYFSSIGQKLTAKLPTINHAYKNYSLPPFAFKIISNIATYKFLYKLKTSTTLDISDINTYLLKSSAHLIAPSLTHIFNLSLYSGILPSDFKIARVTPVYKKSGDPADVSNYRPISVISNISKILEKLVKVQLMHHLTKFKLLSSTQFAYIKGKSTQLAIHTVTERFLQNIENGSLTTACFLDLSKCFDTISHPVLLEKLQNFGIIGTENFWFQSYLSQRTQIVKYNGILSQPNFLPIGVPQGTILGPILFILYINDLGLNLPDCNYTIYADDISLYSFDKTLKGAENKLQSYVNDTVEWLDKNGLIVNPSKSNVMVIGSKQRTENLKLNIFIKNSRIEQTRTFKLLGVNIDNNLTWKQHTSSVVKKISSKIGLVKRLQTFLPNQIIRKLYAPLIQSHLDYCLTVWGNCLSQDRHKIQQLQNRAARVFTNNFDRNVSSHTIRKQLNWMSVSDRFKYLTGCLIYKCLNDCNISSSMQNTFINNFSAASSVHNYNTRFSANNCLYVPRPKTEYLKKSLTYYGVILWNDIPQLIRNADNLSDFKTKYKLYLND